MGADVITDDAIADDTILVVGQDATHRPVLPVDRVGVASLQLDGSRLLVTALGLDGTNRVDTPLGRVVEVQVPTRAARTLVTPVSSSSAGLGSSGWTVLPPRAATTDGRPVGPSVVRRPDGTSRAVRLPDTGDEPLALSAGWLVHRAHYETPQGQVRTSSWPMSVGRGGSFDQWGSRAAWVTWGGGVGWADLDAAPARPHTVLPDRVDLGECSGLQCPRAVTLSGDRLVVQRLDQSIDSFDLRTGARRFVAAASCSMQCGVPLPMDLDADVLAWSSDAVRSLDLSDPTSTPKTVSTSTWSTQLSVSQGRVAWVDADGAVRLATLTAAAHPPADRLLRADATASAFSPNGDGRQEAWAVEADVSRAGSRLVLTVRSGTKVVRSVRATSSGSSRLAWDGRTDAGGLAPDGTYTWTLTGTGPDGRRLANQGHLTGGRVVLDRTAPAARTSVPAVAATAERRGGYLPVTWGPASGSASGLRYDVQQRDVEVTAKGRLAFGAAMDVRRSTSARSATFRDVWSKDQDGYAVQFRARTHDAYGTTGAWSGWTTTLLAVDDRNPIGRRTSGWTRVTKASAYDGSYLRSTRRGAMVSHDQPTRTVGVLVTTCPTCGKLRVEVNGHRSVTVDTYSRTTKVRQARVVMHLSAAGHEVRVTNLATRGRPTIRFDGWVTGP
ncbi:FlgD immunoglobulin-like domain containing protein [Angustibacter aerolatus]